MVFGIWETRNLLGKFVPIDVKTNSEENTEEGLSVALLSFGVVWWLAPAWCTIQAMWDGKDNLCA